MTANLAATFKAEIIRLARKEVRAQTEELRKSVVAMRSEIATLKRRLKESERSATSRRKIVSPLAAKREGVEGGQLRFRADGYATMRARLGLSASDMGLLTGVSGQTVYTREQGAKPRSDEELVAISRLRGMSKAQVHELLGRLRQAKVG